MTSNPFDSGELGRTDPELDQIAERLERYARDAAAQPPLDLAGRIHQAVGREPAPRRSLARWVRVHAMPVRALLAAAAVVLLIAGALALGQFLDRTEDRVGTSPTPTVDAAPTSTPSPSPTPTLSPSPSPSPPPTPSNSPSVTAEPTTTDDGGVETPEPSESDGGDSGNSGPGGGGSGSGSGEGP